MLGRILVIATLVALGGIALDGAPVKDDLQLPTVVDRAAADTCDGWPHPAGKFLDACPHGPTP